MVEVAVTGIGLISALGHSLEATWQHLLAGSSGIKLRQPFAELPPRPLAQLGPLPADFQTLTAKALQAALTDAGLVPPLSHCGVVIGSSRAHQGRWEQLAHPNHHQLDSWLETLPHMAAIHTARIVGTTGPVLAPMAACATGIWALFRGWELLQTGECQQVITGAVEAPITPLTLAGFAKMGALATTGCYPFDIHREGLALGEGGAIFILENAALAKQRGAKIYGKILGFGLTNDALHGNYSDPEGKSAKLAIKQCLAISHLAPTDIHYIHAHGTSTQLNDKFEADIIQQIFPHGVPVSSTKGATGHTLGASGALGAAFSFMALQQQILPPCVGLNTPEFDLDFIIKPRTCQSENSLIFSFGFGGQNAVLAIGR
ncbi:MAG TPA: beta-ketoacyl-ACP synthase [Oscillatoriaceae cyanobacterium M33_DOE_052]|uniref:Beta-ketoacyl-ACP synthase n=1 Tax=Planktothricoides sp. SpSt-374 TaxID=2282167 RepID=A0A7C3ZP19_9CYAN|nr:beta-ketoacyl-ACP synthase [Oscillatoriaceae cyanobacterium M33_DOE_052]